MQLANPALGRVGKSKKFKNKDVELIESSLPVALQSEPFSTKFMKEFQHYHKWFGIIFYHSKHFARIHRVVSLATNVNIMLFMQAVLYNITNPDDGSCELYSSEQDCLSEPSSVNADVSMCYWTASNDGGYCTFRAVSNNAKTVLYMAIIAALLSAPLSLVMDWIIMRVVAAKTTAPKNTVQVANTPGTAGRRRGSFLTFSLVNETENIKTEDGVLGTTLSSDLRNLTQCLQSYRDSLKHFQKRELNGLCSFVLYCVVLY